VFTREWAVSRWVTDCRQDHRDTVRETPKRRQITLTVQAPCSRHSRPSPIAKASGPRVWSTACSTHRRTETFGAFMSHVPGQQHRDRVAFYVVYIEEAHPVDLWQVSANVRDGVLCASPQTEAERAATAETCVVKLAIRMPALVDGIDNRVERAYTGWPDRLYIIAKDGRVRYKSAPGPYGFSTTDLEHALTRLLEQPANE
jgi:iodothyronine deiodinase-like protein